MNLKRQAYNQCIIPVLTYASGTWTLTKNMENRIKITQRRMERAMLGIGLRDRKRNSWIRQQTGIEEDAIMALKRSKWRWRGHLAGTDDRWRTTFWKPTTGTRRRPRGRWKDELRGQMGEE